MARLLVFDFEVFKYDCLLGIMVRERDGSKRIVQARGREEIINAYNEFRNDIWIGHNNEHYDNYILEAVLKGDDPFKISKAIINKQVYGRSKLDLLTYDLMNSIIAPYSLKVTELLVGKNIHTTDVDFNLDRPLTDEEKELTNSYNKDDLLQTDYNLEKFYEKFKLRCDIISEFNLDWREGLKMTGTQIAAAVLKPKKNPALVSMKIKPQLPPNLDLKNEELKKWYLSEGFRRKETVKFNICGETVDIKSGGAHFAVKKYHTKKCIEADVSGMYNILMIEYDLLPRTLDEAGRELYISMYHEQLKIKKSNPKRRKILKTILLSVFGATNNEYTDFYDPEKSLLVTSTGEMFICDLLEKLEPYIKLVQVNTDGVAFEPLDWNNEDKIKEIIHAWEERTKLYMSYDYLYNLWQRDVNNYMCRDEDGKILCRGEAVKNFDMSDEAYSSGAIFACKEPPIVAQGLVNCLMNDISPEQYVEEHKDDLRLFQYSCKKNTFDYLVYNCQTKDGITSIQVQSPSRAFANKVETEIGTLVKHKVDNKGVKKMAKVSNLPDNIFIWNEDILSKDNIQRVQNKIDLRYYINRIYERIGEFI